MKDLVSEGFANVVKPYIDTKIAAVNQTLTNNLSNEVNTRAKLGAHNLNVYPYTDESTTISGIDFTILDDGRIKVGSESAQTATAGAYFYMHKRYNTSNYLVNPLLLKNGIYKINGCPASGATVGYQLAVSITKDGSSQTLGRDAGEGGTFTVNGDDLSNNSAYIAFTINIAKDSVIPAGGIIFEPTISLASDMNNAFAPYAMTNRELTEAVTPVKGSFTYLGATWYYKVFKDYIVIGSEDAVSARMDASSWTTMATITELAGAFQYALNGMLFPNNGDVLKMNLQTTGELRYYRISEGDRAGLYIQDNATLYDIRG